jgi:hypothetical protein
VGGQSASIEQPSSSPSALTETKKTYDKKTNGRTNTQKVPRWAKTLLVLDFFSFLICTSTILPLCILRARVRIHTFFSIWHLSEHCFLSSIHGHGIHYMGFYRVSGRQLAIAKRYLAIRYPTGGKYVLVVWIDFVCSSRFFLFFLFFLLFFPGAINNNCTNKTWGDRISFLGWTGMERMLWMLWNCVLWLCSSGWIFLLYMSRLRCIV